MIRKISPDRDQELEPLTDPGQVTGFSSPAQDYKQDRLHIIEKLVKDPTNTYYFEADNDELVKFGIMRNALLIVDRAITISIGKIVVANHENQWIIRRLEESKGKKYLSAGAIDESRKLVNDQTIFFGVVTWCCNPLNIKSICLL